jgi:hypothetical protein
MVTMLRVVSVVVPEIGMSCGSMNGRVLEKRRALDRPDER